MTHALAQREVRRIFNKAKRHRSPPVKALVVAYATETPRSQLIAIRTKTEKPWNTRNRHHRVVSGVGLAIQAGRGGDRTSAGPGHRQAGARPHHTAAHTAPRSVCVLLSHR
uniref:Uncharacterized protein n=1 Tax=Branchiostoma floridae TaxID=7739 RepID=C3XTY6_BRAFL|eukprot:XP_002612351.1 hypothetical protein BRAFLDRAFT_80014 [Branchiostoma floridae]